MIFIWTHNSNRCQHKIFAILRGLIFLSALQLDGAALFTSQSKDNRSKKPISVEKTESVPKPLIIRVLLEEKSVATKQEILIESPQGFIIQSPIKKTAAQRWKHAKINLLAHRNRMMLLTPQATYKRLVVPEMLITPLNGSFKLNDHSYNGSLHLRIDEKTKEIQLINRIKLDDYLYSVLRFESLPYWPMEMQKIQAIVSRSYALYQIKQARNGGRENVWHDIKNNNFHQVYKGNHECTHLRQAVQETSDLILTYKGNIALTMFDICCGGILPGLMEKCEEDKPYLFRKHNKCTFCRNKSSFSWQCAFNKHSFFNLLKTNPRTSTKTKHLGTLQNIKIKHKDTAGIVHSLTVSGSKSHITLTTNDLKTLIGPKLKSFAYSIKKQNNDLIFHGYGFGHNIGLCQIGAREMVARHKTFKEILAFYFPETKLMRIKLS